MMSNSYQLLSRGSSPTIPQPISTTAPGSSRRRGFLAFFGTAALSGIIFHLIILGFSPATPSGPARDSLAPSSIKDWWSSNSGDSPLDVPPQHIPGSTEEDEYAPRPPICEPSASDAEALVNSTSYIRPGLGQYVVAGEDEWSLEKIRTMVEGTKGYYARDYSLGLGWNNMRYIIETSLLHANLLNRTLILPSFVYARACEWNITVCASFATMVNRGDAIGWSEWRELPIEEQMGWQVPIDIMLDLRHLRKAQPVVTTAEFLSLQGLDPSIERSNGAWARDVYHSGPQAPSLGVIPNHDYDPSGVVRVDKVKKYASGGILIDSPVTRKMIELKGDNLAVKFSDVKGPMGGVAKFGSDEELETILEEHGWAVTYTFAGALGMDYLKSVVEPIKQVVLQSSIKGLVDDYAHMDETVVLLEGETHLNRKPGSLRFTTPAGRDNFANLVLHGMLHIPPIEMLSDRVAERMLKLNDGRMWMAAHMRRGDFVRLGWSMENTVEKHFERVKGRLHNGARTIKEIIQDGGHWKTADVPNVEPDLTFRGLEPPRDGDKFYIATDERSKEGLEYIRSHGGVLIGDLLYPEDRRIVGWPLLLTDVLALLEQSIMAHAAYFYAHAMSSVAGGVVNLRGARGLDPRLTLID